MLHVYIHVYIHAYTTPCYTCMYVYIYIYIHGSNFVHQLHTRSPILWCGKGFCAHIHLYMFVCIWTKYMSTHAWLKNQKQVGLYLYTFIRMHFLTTKYTPNLHFFREDTVCLRIDICIFEIFVHIYANICIWTKMYFLYSFIRIWIYTYGQKYMYIQTKMYGHVLHSNAVHQIWQFPQKMLPPRNPPNPEIIIVDYIFKLLSPQTYVYNIVDTLTL